MKYLKKTYCYYIFALTVLQSHPMLSQITGKAFLAAQQYHNDIKVIFIPLSPSAIRDSTLTDSLGNYSISINGGVYKVLFTKNGYQDYDYSNGDPITLNGNEILSSITLQPGNIEYISGNYSGHMLNTTSYIIVGDLYIPVDDTLIIEKGTVIKINSDCNIHVYGFLYACGDSISPIIFTSSRNDPSAGDWSGILFYNSANDNSIISHSVVEYGGDGTTGNGSINIDQSNPTIENNIIRYINGNAIYFEDHSSSIIRNNNIHDFSIIGIWPDWGNNTPLIEGNTVYNGYKGIKASSYTAPVISGNTIFNMETCIDVGNSSSPIIVNNALFSSVNGITCGNYSNTNLPTPLIYNNYIYNNSIAGIDYYDYAQGYIKMNIIINNSVGILACIKGQPNEISYNLIWNNDYDYYDVSQIGIGQIVTTNSNGAECDPYYNISENPAVISLDSLYILDSISPCIDAGEPNSDVYHIDFYGNCRYWDGNHDNDTIIDIGPFEYNSVPYIPPAANSIISLDHPELFLIYPNPCRDYILIKSYINKECDVEIFDLNGKFIKIKYHIKTINTVQKIDISSLANGLFFIRFISNDVTFTKKMVKF